MTVIETKERIEKELAEIKASFGAAERLVKYTVEIGENNIDGAPTDITYIFGSFSLGTEDMSEEDRLYLPLDAELDDDDNVNEEAFEKNLADFKRTVAEIREKLLSAEDYDEKLCGMITEFDTQMEKKYLEEMERINAGAKKRLTIAAIAAAVACVVAVIVLVIDKL